MHQNPSQFPCSFSYGVFILMTQQTMGHIDVKPYHVICASCCNFHSMDKLTITSVYCPFFCRHNNIKIDDITLSVFNAYQGLIAMNNFPPLLMQ